jgi:hypothetical protein
MSKNILKKWQHAEIKKLLAPKPDSIRKDHFKITQTFEITFPYCALTEPVRMWNQAAEQVTKCLNTYERMIADVILCKTKSEWLDKKKVYSKAGYSKE